MQVGSRYPALAEVEVKGLAAELAFDAGRLWLRNLGRDDRLISAHGREARFPYLDEAV